MNEKVTRDFKRAAFVNLVAMPVIAVLIIVCALFEKSLSNMMLLGIIAASVLSCALSMCVLTKTGISRKNKVIITAAFHMILLYAACLANQRNSITFTVATVSQLITAYFFIADALAVQLIIMEFTIAFIWMSGGTMFTECFIAKDYIFGMLYLLFQYIILSKIIATRQEGVDDEAEWRRSASDLVKVIEKKCDDALVATRSKSDFLANMSHEIRTPINAVLGMDEMIMRESSDETVLSYAGDIKKAGTTLLNLVNDILDFSKIESGKMELTPVGYDLPSMINEIANMVGIRALEKGLSFQINADPAIPRVLYGDEVRIKQVIVNLLTNAVKYTKEGSVILSLAYEKEEDFVINLKVSVKDTGIGIKEEDIEKLYNPFERFDQKRNRSIEGTGLGMTIVNNLLGLMDSRLCVESEYEKGSVFSFTIRQEVENWEGIGDLNEISRKVKEKPKAYKAKLYAPRARILVVDDLNMNLTVFKALLKETHIMIDTSLSGKEAVSMCRSNKYDMIYLDHMMPEMDGIETFRTLRTDDDGLNGATPIVCLTANAISGARDEYMGIGFDDYLTKPVDPEKLEASLLRFLPEALVEQAPETGMSDGMADANAEDAEASGGDETSGIMEQLRQIPYISVDSALEMSQDEGLYVSIVSEFVLTIDSRADTIEKYYNERDCHNYTIQVHALKSAARIIGDNELSGMALDLEMAGKDENWDAIEAGTEPLLERFRILKECLEPVFEKDEDENLPLIEDAQITEAVDVMKQGIEDFDFDMVESVMEQLSQYRLPDSFKDTYKKLKVALAEVDYEVMEEILNAI